MRTNVDDGLSLSAPREFANAQCATEYAIKRENTKLPRNTPARTLMKYPQFIVMVAIINK